jgi:DNA polymerase-3 subunit beta
MKFTVERAVLIKALAHVQSVVERRNTIPILANVLLAAQDDALRLTATDMEIAVVEEVPGVQVARPGRTTAPAATLYEIVRKLPEGARVELDHGGGEAPLKLRAGRFHTDLSVLPVEDFPSMTEGKLPHRFTLGAGQVRDLVDRTRFAISTEETRYYLNGIYLHAAESEGAKVLRAVATDGHRLAQVEMPVPEGASGMPGVIVPRKAVAEVLRLLDDLGGDVDVEVSDSKIRFTFKGLVLTSKLIDGAFPDYARVIPRANDKQLLVQRDEFTHAVDRVSTVSSERGRAVKLSLAEGRLILTVTNPDSGSATEELPVDYAASPLDIGFNSRYLLDIAAQLEGDTALFRLSDPGSPTLVQDKEGEGALYVLMPMRV